MNYDCIIVGAGPTGAVLGGLLSRAGHSVLLLERDHEVYALPRAVHMDHEIMRVLQELNVLEALQPYMHDMDTYRFESAAGEALLESRGNGRLACSGYVSSARWLRHLPARWRADHTTMAISNRREVGRHRGVFEIAAGADASSFLDRRSVVRKI